MIEEILKEETFSRSTMRSPARGRCCQGQASPGINTDKCTPCGAGCNIINTNSIRRKCEHKHRGGDMWIQRSQIKGALTGQYLTRLDYSIFRDIQQLC